MKRYVCLFILSLLACMAQAGDVIISASATFEDSLDVGYYFSISPMYGADGMNYLMYPSNNGTWRQYDKIGTVSSQVSGVTIEWASGFTNGEYAYFGFESVNYFLPS